jgi:hypothetical protein
LSSVSRLLFSVQGEMRLLNKENRGQAEALIKEGGLKLTNDLLKPGVYDLTLLTPTEDFFAFSSDDGSYGIVDGMKPVLLLVNRQTM